MKMEQANDAVALALFPLLALSCAGAGHSGPPGPEKAKALAAALGRSLDPNPPLRGIPLKTLGIAALALLGIVLVAGLVAFLASRRRRSSSNRGPSIAEASSFPAIGGPELAEEARQAAARGEHRIALDLLYRACFAFFAEWKLLPEDPSLTSGDAFRRLSPSLAANFRPIARLAEKASFGRGEVEAADWGQAEEAFDSMAASWRARGGQP
jgi:hypothetical protein